MSLLRILFPGGIWIAGLILWTAAAVTARGASPTQPSHGDEWIAGAGLEGAMQDYVTSFGPGSRCPSSGCVTLDVHFTSFTSAVRAKEGGQWIIGLNRQFAQGGSQRYVVFRFKSWTPASETLKPGACRVPAHGQVAELRDAVSRCKDAAFADPAAINVFVVADTPGADGARSQAIGDLNDDRPVLRVPASALMESAADGESWTLHQAMRQALGLPTEGGGRSPSFSMGELDLLVKNVDRVHAALGR